MQYPLRICVPAVDVMLTQVIKNVHNHENWQQSEVDFANDPLFESYALLRAQSKYRWRRIVQS